MCGWKTSAKSSSGKLARSASGRRPCTTTSALEDSGKTAAKRQGYLMTLIEGRAVVQWKDAYIDACGPLAADELQKHAPRSVKVSVQKAA
jgi:hypothetical protein